MMEYRAAVKLKFLKNMKWHVRQDGLVFPKEGFSAEPCALEVLFGKKLLGHVSLRNSTYYNVPLEVYGVLLVHERL